MSMSEINRIRKAKGLVEVSSVDEAITKRVEGSYLYFAYGMNLDPHNMPGCRLVGPAIIRGWRYDFRAFADVQRSDDPAEYTAGLLWEVDDAALRMLDSREGYHSARSVGNLYDRVETDFEMIEPGHRDPREEFPGPYGSGTAIIYTMPFARRLQVPGEWYMNLVFRAITEFGLPEDYFHAAVARCEAEEAAA